MGHSLDLSNELLNKEIPMAIDCFSIVDAPRASDIN